MLLASWQDQIRRHAAVIGIELVVFLGRDRGGVSPRGRGWAEGLNASAGRRYDLMGEDGDALIEGAS